MKTWYLPLSKLLLGKGAPNVLPLSLQPDPTFPKLLPAKLAGGSRLSCGMLWLVLLFQLFWFGILGGSCWEFLGGMGNVLLLFVDDGLSIFHGGVG